MIDLKPSIVKLELKPSDSASQVVNETTMTSILLSIPIFYHGVGEISDLSQSEAPNLVMWRVMVMQPRPRLLGDEVVVGPNLMFRKMDPWNVIRNILQDKTDKNQL